MMPTDGAALSVVLAGGGAHMKNVVKLVEKVFGLPCHIGKPRGVSGLATVTEGPEYAAIVGMARYGIKSMEQKERSGKSIFGIVRKIFGK